ncbi:MAG TPA: hypothetical protein VE197_21240, partial [Mycobacterium sp.]|nr:hypothetical protein [Mycobacterium sp.]
TDLTYYGNGNLHTITGPANLHGDRQTLVYQYDAALATYPVSVMDDHFHYESTAVYNPYFGKPEKTTDLNGNDISYDYDQFGRTIDIKGPYEQGSDRTTLHFDYHQEAPTPYALTEHLNLDAAGTAHDPIDTVLFTDGLKRVLQTKKSASVNGQDKMIVSGRVVFDGLGRTIKQYYPVTEATTLATTFNSDATESHVTTTDYDVLDRTVHTKLPDGTDTWMAYGFDTDRDGNLQFSTKVTDAEGHSKFSYRNVRELITAVKEFNKGDTLWTSYAYDPLKQIVDVKDVKGKHTTVEYDELGRRTSIDNRDTGKTVMVYDSASNVVQKITANLGANDPGKYRPIRYDY